MTVHQTSLLHFTLNQISQALSSNYFAKYELNLSDHPAFLTTTLYIGAHSIKAALYIVNKTLYMKFDSEAVFKFPFVSNMRLITINDKSKALVTFYVDNKICTLAMDVTCDQYNEIFKIVLNEGNLTERIAVSSMPPQANESDAIAVKKCDYCESTSTPMWRRGPKGRGTLCNACGVKWKNGKILLETAYTMSKGRKGGRPRKSESKNELDHLSSVIAEEIEKEIQIELGSTAESKSKDFNSKENESTSSNSNGNNSNYSKSTTNQSMVPIKKRRFQVEN